MEEEEEVEEEEVEEEEEVGEYPTNKCDIPRKLGTLIG